MSDKFCVLSIISIFRYLILVSRIGVENLAQPLQLRRQPNGDDEDDADASGDEAPEALMLDGKHDLDDYDLRVESFVALISSWPCICDSMEHRVDHIGIQVN